MGGVARVTQAQALRRKQQEQLVQRAISQQREGQALTQGELRAFEKWELDQDERRGLRWVETIPKKFWSQWSGRQHRTLAAQAALYGIPLDGKAVSVPAIARWLHDFLAKHKQPLSELVKQSDDPAGEAKSLQGQKLTQQIEQLKRRNKILDAKIAADRRQLVSRELIHTHLARAAQLLRAAGDRLYKRCGDEAGDILAEAIDDFQQIIDELQDSQADSTQDSAVTPLD